MKEEENKLRLTAEQEIGRYDNAVTGVRAPSTDFGSS